MSEILQILPFKKIKGEVIAVEIQNFGSHSVIFLIIKTAKKKPVKLLLSDIALHLIPGGLANLKGKMVEIQADTLSKKRLITIVN